MQAMNVLVLLSGIADPKWQLPEPVTETSLRTQRASYPLLSPFDEAALEVALKLRDADEATKIFAKIWHSDWSFPPLPL